MSGTIDMAMGMNGDGQVSVFTTNYDRAVEVFCEATDRPMYDGFKINIKTGRRVWAANFGAGKDKGGEGGAIRLYKLHGSLDWKSNPKHGVLKVDYDGASDSAYYEDILIYPSLADKGDKIKYKPYREIYKSFKEELQSSDVCVVIGFSFRDRHIVDELCKLAEHGSKTLIVVGPDAHKDVCMRILEQESYNKADSVDMEVSRTVSILTRDGKSRRAVVITKKWTASTTREIVARVHSAIESKCRLMPVHTPGSCTYCEDVMTVDDMEKHIATHCNEPEGSEALLLRIAEHPTGAPWILVLARLDATLGDLAKFLQVKWIPPHYPAMKQTNVRFATKLPSTDIDIGMALSDVPWDQVSAWCNDMDRLRVAVVRSIKVRELREPVKVLAAGEKPLF